MPSPITGQTNRPSSLPQQIPPQTAELGTVIQEIDQSTGRSISKVRIDINWWLFLLNISKQVLSAPGSPIPIVNVATSLTLDEDLVPPNPQPQTVIDWMSPI